MKAKLEEIRIKTDRNMFHTIFYYENDAMNGRIKDPYDEISHKIPTEWSHDVFTNGESRS